MRNIRADEQRKGKSRDRARDIEEESGGRGKLGRAIRDLPLCSVLYFSKRVCVCVCVCTVCGYVVHCVEYVQYVQYKGYK